MTDFIAALGLVLVIEGLLWAIAPQLARKMIEASAAAPEQRLRIGGLVAVATGVLVVWLVRG